MRTWMLLGLMGFAMMGCRTDLETGYVPRRLGASDTERRGYYARPFSREAMEARQEERFDRGPEPSMGRHYR